MSTDQLDMTTEHQNLIYYSNLTFYVIFVIEMLINILGLGIRRYV
jgi:hypothetical protein